MYIDALFRTESGTWNSEVVRDVLPYNMDPAVIMVSDDSGNIRTFTGNKKEEVKKMLEELSRYLDSIVPQERRFVGWNLDSVVIPCICSACFRYGVNMHMWMRDPSDKWSKTYGYSMERGLVQGWYPSSKEADVVPITLDDASVMCGMTPLAMKEKMIQEDPDNKEKLSSLEITLLARLSAISSLYTRYSEITRS